MGKRKLTHDPPTCNCLLLCDDVMVSTGRQKHFLNGVIGTIVSRFFPTRLGGYVAYLRFSNMHPSQEIAIALVAATTDESLFEFIVKTPKEADPLGVYTVVVPIPPFDVEQPGRYMFRAVSGGEILAQAPLLVQGLDHGVGGE